MDTTDYQRRMDMRHRLAEGIKNLTMSENPAPDTLRSWVESLSLLAVDYDSLNPDTKILMCLLTYDILQKARSKNTNKAAR